MRKGTQGKGQAEVTRRSFVQGAACMGAGLAAAGAALGTSAQQAAAGEVAQGAGSFASSVAWDAEYDVVVVGYGFAGGTTAIAAADAGASVLLVDKCMRGLEGGNSRYAGQGFTVPRDDPAQLVEYFQSIRGYYSTPSDAMIQAYVDKAVTGMDWLVHLGMDRDAIRVQLSAGEYKELPGGTGDDADNGPCAYLYCSKGAFDGAHYRLVQDNVASRSDQIDVWYECPATHLVQDPETKTVHGVEIEHDGQAYRVRARNGVVLTTGGYENNRQMLEDYVLMPCSVPFGSDFNTGDGVTMAVEAGARLWHMANIAGPIWAFQAPGCDHGYTNLMKPTGTIIVGPSGERFMKEGGMGRHGHISYGGHYEQQPKAYPAYALADADWMAQNRLFPQFSEGNKEEIEAGWVISADTVAELAEKIYDDMPDFARLPNYTADMGPYADRLQAAVDRWNASVEAGVDEQFGRAARTMAPIATPPFYALPLSMMMFNTQGGPERDEQARVIGRDGNPIPHLFSAGELGAMWSDIYNGGCNIGECVMYGRIAGENAAKAPEDAVAGNLVAGEPVSFPAPAEELPELGENQYLGIGHGIGGDLDVVCTIVDGQIQDVQVTRSFETPGFGSKAVAALPAEFVAANGVGVETVSGATSTSNALIAAVADCMRQAGMEVVQDDGEVEYEVSGAVKSR